MTAALWVPLSASTPPITVMGWSVRLAGVGFVRYAIGDLGVRTAAAPPAGTGRSRAVGYCCNAVVRRTVVVAVGRNRYGGCRQRRGRCRPAVCRAAA